MDLSAVYDTVNSGKIVYDLINDYEFVKLRSMMKDYIVCNTPE